MSESASMGVCVQTRGVYGGGNQGLYQCCNDLKVYFYDCFCTVYCDWDLFVHIF